MCSLIQQGNMKQNTEATPRDIVAVARRLCTAGLGNFVSHLDHLVGSVGLHMKTSGTLLQLWQGLMVVVLLLWGTAAVASTERLGEVVCRIDDEGITETTESPTLGPNEKGSVVISGLASEFSYGALVRMVFQSPDGVVRVLVLDVPLSGGDESFVVGPSWMGDWLYYEGNGNPPDFFADELTGVLVTLSSFEEGAVVLDGAAFDFVATDFGDDAEKGSADDAVRTLAHGVVFVETAAQLTVTPPVEPEIDTPVIVWVEPTDPWADSWDTDTDYGCGGSSDDYDEEEDDAGCGSGSDDGSYEDDTSEGCQGDTEEDDDSDDGCVGDAEASQTNGTRVRKPRWVRHVETLLPFLLLTGVIHILRRRAV